jgi:adenosylcobinamide kinase/adenosylcobinamide-phosphate guanylyltransferase
LDKEMKQRILLHRSLRPKHWKTYEKPKELVPLLTKLGNSFDCLIIDCLTLLISNFLLERYSEKRIAEKIETLLAGFKKNKAKVIMVSNEVGLGIVPANKLGRAFRDIAGKVNQIVAQKANEVFFTIAGIPLRVKGENEAPRVSKPAVLSRRDKWK